jgi:hypothetical protein
MDGPLQYAVKAPRSSELIAWLGFNGVRAGDVPYPSQIFVETEDGAEWVIRYEAYARSESGRLKYDLRTETFEYVECQAPLMYDPPMWWLKRTAPLSEH